MIKKLFIKNLYNDSNNKNLSSPVNLVNTSVTDDLFPIKQNSFCDFIEYPENKTELKTYQVIRTIMTILKDEEQCSDNELSDIVLEVVEFGGVHTVHVWASQYHYENQYAYDTNPEGATTNYEFSVMSDNEADRQARERVEDYVEEEISQLPDLAKDYFNTDKRVDDILAEGRGYQLAYYDHEEHDITLEDDEFNTNLFAYRTN